MRELQVLHPDTIGVGSLDPEHRKGSHRLARAGDLETCTQLLFSLRLAACTAERDERWLITDSLWCEAHPAWSMHQAAEHWHWHEHESNSPKLALKGLVAFVDLSEVGAAPGRTGSSARMCKRWLPMRLSFIFITWNQTLPWCPDCVACKPCHCSFGMPMQLSLSSPY